MEWMSLNTLREKYLSFFESKDHLRLESFSLVPNNDKSLLLINSGMAPMKKYFTGEITPPSKRVTTCQKCIRTPDIERVGKTARHGTYFEMLGNFSFGNYFKDEATAWAWEFCTKVLDMPIDKLWVTIYQDDDEAFRIWTQNVGVSPERIVRMGKEDNFWEHGCGPCGPCSEIYFDRGEKYGCDNPSCGVGCECDRYVEFWNLVFTQFDSDGKGNYVPLANPNIDTGMGLERLACISQGVDNLFEVDTVQNIMRHLSKIAGIEYKKNVQADVSMRVITDHIRSTSFMISDGVFPSNEGRGYVLRRLLRRAARHGRLLGIEHPFLVQLCETVIAENKNGYPELGEKSELIKKIIGNEEKSFNKTIDQGLKMLEESMAEETFKILSGSQAFMLYDTYGFPLDLTKDILEEKGYSVDEDTFLVLMKEQRERARNARKNDTAEAWNGESNVLAGIKATNFCGYNNNDCQSQVVAIIKDGALVDFVGEGDAAAIVLDSTPFYAESGGQVGDTGLILLDENMFEVDNTVKNHEAVITHIGEVKTGVINCGMMVNAVIDIEARTKIKRNHTAAHLLQAALRSVLGTHVEQAGQLVNANTLRFDFTHFSALTAKEIRATEDFVNNAILDFTGVVSEEMPIEKARKMGAMALFGEKYGSLVRVVSVGDKSAELCGGTHVDNTAKLGLFKIISESSVASGVRRIEAVTGTGVLSLIDKSNENIKGAAAALRLGNPSELVRKCEQIAAEIKEKDREIEKLNSEISKRNIEGLFDDAKEISGLRIITASFKNITNDALSGMCDRIRDADPCAVAAIVSIKENSAAIAVTAGKVALERGVHSGKTASAIAAIAGGKGGGRADFAMAGAKDITKINEALAAAADIVISMLK